MADHFYAVKTWDAIDAGPSPWPTETRVIPTAKVNPTLTAPTGTVGASDTATWTVSEQSKYRVVVSDTSSTTNMSAGSLEFDSGLVNDSVARSLPITFPTNSVTRYVRLQTANALGLLSDIQENTVTVAFTPPSVPTLVATGNTPTGAIGVVITNPGLGAAEANNDLFRRLVGDTGNGIRVAAGVAVDGTFNDYTVASGKAYEYKVRAFGTNGTQIDGAWTA